MNILRTRRPQLRLGGRRLCVAVVKNANLAYRFRHCTAAVRGEKNIIAIISVILLSDEDLFRRYRRRHALITAGFVYVSGFITRV